MKKHIAMIIFVCGLAGGMLSACVQQKNVPIADEEIFLPPEDLIIANIQETDISLAFELVRVNVQSEPGTGLYGEWELEGIVFYSFDNKMQPGEHFTCYQVFEKGIPAPQLGTRFIGSFKKTAQGKYVVPDNGYLFSYHPDLLTMFEKGMKVKKSKQ